MFTTRPELVGTYGMVASTHWLAPSAGMAVLESGGNAFDAAVGEPFAPFRRSSAGASSSFNLLGDGAREALDPRTYD